MECDSLDCNSLEGYPSPIVHHIKAGHRDCDILEGFDIHSTYAAWPQCSSKEIEDNCAQQNHALLTPENAALNLEASCPYCCCSDTQRREATQEARRLVDPSNKKKPDKPKAPAREKTGSEQPSNTVLTLDIAAFLNGVQPIESDAAQKKKPPDQNQMKLEKFQQMKVADLQRELRLRELEEKGSKIELLARLLESEASHDASQDNEAEPEADLQAMLEQCQPLLPLQCESGPHEVHELVITLTHNNETRTVRVIRASYKYRSPKTGLQYESSRWRILGANEDAKKVKCPKTLQAADADGEWRLCDSRSRWRCAKCKYEYDAVAYERGSRKSEVLIYEGKQRSLMSLVFGLKPRSRVVLRDNQRDPGRERGSITWPSHPEHAGDVDPAAELVGEQGPVPMECKCDSSRRRIVALLTAIDCAEHGEDAGGHTSAGLPVAIFGVLEPSRGVVVRFNVEKGVPKDETKKGDKGFPPHSDDTPCIMSIVYVYKQNKSKDGTLGRASMGIYAARIQRACSQCKPDQKPPADADAGWCQCGGYWLGESWDRLEGAKLSVLYTALKKRKCCGMPPPKSKRRRVTLPLCETTEPGRNTWGENPTRAFATAYSNRPNIEVPEVPAVSQHRGIAPHVTPCEGIAPHVTPCHNCNKLRSRIQGLEQDIMILTAQARQLVALSAGRSIDDGQEEAQRQQMEIKLQQMEQTESQLQQQLERD